MVFSMGFPRRLMKYHAIKTKLDTNSGYLLLIAFALLLALASCSSDYSKQSSKSRVTVLDLTSYSAEKPGTKLNLLFIHHSCGATLLASTGEKKGPYCLWPSHPNGGGLRALLEKNNYSVHEATYGSKIGQHTDINDWHKKFRDHMDIMLRTDLQDKLYSGSERNNIVVFKSCYPNNLITADGTPPGDPDSPKRTLWNCKAAYNSLLPIFERYPHTLFVAVTAPPVVRPRMNPIKGFLLRLIGKDPEKIGQRARAFNNWLKDVKSGWLSKYKGRNVVVFDYYDILTGKGKSNWAEYPTRNGRNSHPSAEGNRIAAQEFVKFLNRAVRYAGIVQ